jgi:predicted amidohydrolase YtcJ
MRTKPRQPLEPGALAGLQAPWALVGAHVRIAGGRRCDAIAFGRDGNVAACGTSDEVAASLPDGTELVDGGDATVWPGFVDAHVHVRASASAALATDVSRAASPAEIVAAVRRAPRGHGGWVTLVGSELTAGRGPDRRALDSASGGSPVRIRDRSGHGWLFNTPALRALRLDQTPMGVIVERDEAGEPTGFVADHVGWVGSRIGRVSGSAAMTAAVRSWSHELARMGVVAICDATATNDAPQVEQLLRWREQGVLRQELTYLSSPGAAPDGVRGPRHGGIKFADAEDARLEKALRQGARTRLPVAVHCVDPFQTAAVLQVSASIPDAERGPLRIEHASFVPPDWIADFKRLGATVVTHPAFITAHGDRYLADPLLEPHDWLYRLASWTRAGVPLAFGSDAPFGPADPLAALRAAAHRRTASGAQIGADEALSAGAALRAATAGAAACSGLDRFGYGVIRPRGPGAAVILGPDQELVATVIGGNVVD